MDAKLPRISFRAAGSPQKALASCYEGWGWIFLVVQRLRIRLPSAGDAGLIPGLGRFHMPQDK